MERGDKSINIRFACLSFPVSWPHAPSPRLLSSRLLSEGPQSAAAPRPSQHLPLAFRPLFCRHAQRREGQLAGGGAIQGLMGVIGVMGMGEGSGT